LRDEFGDQGVELVYYYMEMMGMLEQGQLEKVTQDAEKISGHSPRKVDIMFKEFADLFRP
jgi:hypothetical protein